jgi:CRP-like cAMP-binding protein
MSSYTDSANVKNSQYNKVEEIKLIHKEEDEKSDKIFAMNKLDINRRQTEPSKNIGKRIELLNIKQRFDPITTSNIQNIQNIQQIKHRGSNLVLLEALSDNLRFDQEETPKSKNEFLTPYTPYSPYTLPIKVNQSKESRKSESQKSKILSSSYSSSSSDDDEEKDQVVELQEEAPKKPKNDKAMKLWGKLKNIVKGMFNFQKMTKNLQLYGTSEEQFDENNPEAYLKKLRRIQTVADFKDEKSEHHNKFCCKIPVFNPDGNLMMGWNILVMLLMFYTAIIMPYRVSFIEEDDPNWVVLENIIDMVFFSDVLVTLNLAYYDKDNIYIDSRKKIFVTYLKSWLIIDIVASFPQNLVLNSNNSSLAKSTDILRLARLSRLYRLIRIIRFLKIAKFFRKVALVQRIQDFLRINYGISRLISFLFTTLIISHLVGCLWYILPKIYDEQINWVTQSGLQDEEPFRLYLFSIYWSFATIFTVGFGDIHAYNAIEYLISIFWMLFGVGFYSFTIGTLSSVLVNMDTRENILKGKLAILNQFSKETKLSSNLKEKIKKILIYNSQKNVFSWLDKQEIFNELPANLKFEIAKSMRNGFLKDILFFTPKYDSFIAMIVPFLLPLNFQNKEPIYKKNDHPTASNFLFTIVYFLTLGRVHFVNDDYVPFRTMVRGCYFGEIEILHKKRRTHSVYAGENCDTLTLSKHIYENVIAKEYPEVESELKKIAAIRIEKNMEAEKEISPRKRENVQMEPVQTDNLINETKKKKKAQNSIIDRRVSKVANTINTSNNSFSSSQKNPLGNSSIPSQSNANINIVNNTYNTNIFNLNNNNKRFSKIIDSKSKNHDSKSKIHNQDEKEQNESESLSSSDHSSDYLSSSEQQKIENKLEMAKEYMRSELPFEDKTSKNDEEIVYLKQEMAKYSQQQKEILENINSLLIKLDKK